MYQKERIIVDDSNFIFLESGTYPIDYIGLEPAINYPSYFNNVIKPWRDGHNYTNSRLDNWNDIEKYPIQEYWERIPDSIRQFGNAYSTNIPENVYVSSFGRVYDFDSKTAIPVYLRKDGYIGVFHMMALHRIILYTFNPILNFLEMTVDHKDLNTTNNCLWNLRWMNMYDNIQRSVESGNRTNPYFKSGEENKNSTVSDYEIELCCRALLTHKYSYDQIAFALGISKREVIHIKNCDHRLDICEKYGMQNNNFNYKHLKNQKENILPLVDVNQQ